MSSISAVSFVKRFATLAVILVIAWAADLAGVTAAIDRHVGDLRFLVAPREPTGKVVLVDIDEKSLLEIGVWPWPRSIHGELVNAAQKAGAEQVAFDVDFSTNSPSPEADASFAVALAASTIPTYLAAFIQRDPSGSETLVSSPIAPLIEWSWPVVVNVPVDPDGLVRTFPIQLAIGAATLPSLPAVLSNREEPAGIVGIDYAIDDTLLQRVSYVDLLKGRLPEGALQGKSLIVGATAYELRDLFSIPKGRIVSGTTVLALATETLLQGRELSALKLPWYLVVLAGMILPLLLGRRGPLQLSLCIVLISAGVEILALVLQHELHFSLASANLQVVLFLLGSGSIAKEFAQRRIHLWKARAEKRNSDSLLERVIEAGFEGIIIIDEQGAVVRVNEAAQTMLKLPPKVAALQKFPAIVQNILDVKRTFSAGTSVQGLIFRENFEWQGKRSCLEYTVAPFHFSAISQAAKNEAADTVYACLMIRDVTERQSAEDNLRHMALHDSLTGLHNRRSVEAHLADITTPGSPETGHALLYFDMDRFKAVNDSLGHSVGDYVLVEIASRAERVLGEDAVIARIGGDEFAAIIAADSADAARQSAKALGAAAARPIEINGHAITVGVCVGITWWDRGGSAPGSERMRQADIALYHAKAQGRDQIVLFAPAMEKRRIERIQLEQDLVVGFDRGEFQVLYQPQVSLRTGRLVGAEALLRWYHPSNGLVPPDKFIPIAEEIGLIHRLGAWVLSTGCRDATTWPDHIKLAVNVSSIQFETGDLTASVSEALIGSGLPPSRLELEITESAFVKENSGLVAIFDQLMSLGIKFALDDFGTGYSSLGYLHRFPIAKIKIDKSFVNNVPGDGQAMAILRSIRALAEGLGIQTIAEGIETTSQEEVLRALGCDHGQGYLYSKPVTAAALSQMIAMQVAQDEVRETAVA